MKLTSNILTSKDKLLILLTTFKREDKLFRLLDSILSVEFGEISSFIEIHIADDDPDSNLSLKIDNKFSSYKNLFYSKNTKNLGQGENLINSLGRLTGYSYYLCPGDDDIFDSKEFIYVVKKLFQIRPALMVLEFRQGSNLENGTYFLGPSRFASNSIEAISCITNFGKGSSCIFSEVSSIEIKYLESLFKHSMYQDKAICIFSYLKNIKRGLYIHTKVVVYNNDVFVPLRYSTRIYSNLPKTINLALIVSSLNLGYITAEKLPFLYILDRKSVLIFWVEGILLHLSPFSQFRYTSNRFFRELKYPFSCLMSKKDYFERRY